MKPAFVARALVCAFPCLAIAQVATLQIKILEGDAAVHVAGSRSARPLAVQVTDDLGRPVAGAAVSFRLPEEGPGGLFANRLRTEVVVSDANGHATVRNVQLNNTPGTFQIRITAAKEQARAGTLARQFIEGGGAAAKPKLSKRWILVGLVVGGVAGGVGAGMAGKPAPARPVPPASLVMAGPPVTVGTPVVSVGRP
jgi:hypothetical protein